MWSGGVDRFLAFEYILGGGGWDEVGVRGTGEQT